MLLRARRNDEVEEELTREARRGLGEHLLEGWSSGGDRTWKKNEMTMQNRGYNIVTFSRQTKCISAYVFLPFAVPAVSLQGLVSLCWGLLSLLLGQVLDKDREGSPWRRDSVGVSMPPGSVASG